MKWLKAIIFIIFTIFLFGCSSTRCLDTGQVAQMQINALTKKLAFYDVKMLCSDNSVSLVLPNKIFFNSGSANFTDDAYEALNLISDLANYYDKSVVAVTGSAGLDITAWGKAIAAERAHKVVSYLWRQGIDASFMYANAAVLQCADCVIINWQKKV